LLRAWLLRQLRRRAATPSRQALAIYRRQLEHWAHRALARLRTSCEAHLALLRAHASARQPSTPDDTSEALAADLGALEG